MDNDYNRNQLVLLAISTVIGLGVGCVALQQYFLARQKFKLDLFEKRLAVYKAVYDYLEAIRKSGDCSDKVRHEFDDKTRVAKFLFDKDVTDFVDKLYSMGVRLNLCNHGNEQFDLKPHQLELNEKIKEETIRAFMDYSENFETKFIPYLHYRNWIDERVQNLINKIKNDYKS